MRRRNQRKKQYEQQVVGIRWRLVSGLLFLVLLAVSLGVAIWYSLPQRSSRVFFSANWVNYVDEMKALGILDGLADLEVGQRNAEYLSRRVFSPTVIKNHATVTGSAPDVPGEVSGDRGLANELKSIDSRTDIPGYVRNLTDRDVLVVYLCGHCFVNEAGDVVIRAPEDRDSDVEIPLSTLLRNLDRSPAKQKLLLLDGGQWTWSPFFGERSVNTFPAALARQLEQNRFRTEDQEGESSEFALSDNLWIVTSHAAYERSLVTHQNRRTLFADAIGAALDSLRTSEVNRLEITQLYLKIKEQVAIQAHRHHSDIQPLQTPLLMRPGLGVITTTNREALAGDDRSLLIELASLPPVREPDPSETATESTGLDRISLNSADLSLDASELNAWYQSDPQQALDCLDRYLLGASFNPDYRRAYFEQRRLEADAQLDSALNWKPPINVDFDRRKLKSKMDGITANRQYLLEVAKLNRLIAHLYASGLIDRADERTAARVRDLRQNVLRTFVDLEDAQITESADPVLPVKPFGEVTIDWVDSLLAQANRQKDYSLYSLEQLRRLRDRYARILTPSTLPPASGSGDAGERGGAAPERFADRDYQKRISFAQLYQVRLPESTADGQAAEGPAGKKLLQEYLAFVQQMAWEDQPADRLGLDQLIKGGLSSDSEGSGGWASTDGRKRWEMALLGAAECTPYPAPLPGIQRWPTLTPEVFVQGVATGESSLDLDQTRSLSLAVSTTAISGIRVQCRFEAIAPDQAPRLQAHLSRGDLSIRESTSFLTSAGSGTLSGSVVLGKSKDERQFNFQIEPGEITSDDLQAFRLIVDVQGESPARPGEPVVAQHVLTVSLPNPKTIRLRVAREQMRLKYTNGQDDEENNASATALLPWKEAARGNLPFPDNVLRIRTLPNLASDFSFSVQSKSPVDEAYQANLYLLQCDRTRLGIADAGFDDQFFPGQLGPQALTRLVQALGNGQQDLKEMKLLATATLDGLDSSFEQLAWAPPAENASAETAAATNRPPTDGDELTVPYGLLFTLQPADQTEPQWYLPVRFDPLDVKELFWEASLDEKNWTRDGKLIPRFKLRPELSQNQLQLNLLPRLANRQPIEIDYIRRASADAVTERRSIAWETIANQEPGAGVELFQNAERTRGVLFFSVLGVNHRWCYTWNGLRLLPIPENQYGFQLEGSDVNPDWIAFTEQNPSWSQSRLPWVWIAELAGENAALRNAGADPRWLAGPQRLFIKPRDAEARPGVDYALPLALYTDERGDGQRDSDVIYHAFIYDERQSPTLYRDQNTRACLKWQDGKLRCWTEVQNHSLRVNRDLLLDARDPIVVALKDAAMQTRCRFEIRTAANTERLPAPQMVLTRGGAVMGSDDRITEQELLAGEVKLQVTFPNELSVPIQNYSLVINQVELFKPERMEDAAQREALLEALRSGQSLQQLMAENGVPFEKVGTIGIQCDSRDFFGRQSERTEQKISVSSRPRAGKSAGGQ